MSKSYEQMRAERAVREAEARVFHGRRQFAGIALRALMSTHCRYTVDSESGKCGLAKAAFDWADAMLAEEKARYAP